MSNNFQNELIERKQEGESTFRIRGEQISKKSQEIEKPYSRKSNKYSWHRSEILQDGYSKEDIKFYYTENLSGTYSTVSKF